MIRGEPYTLGLFDTAGKFVFYSLNFIAFPVELRFFLAQWICGVVSPQVRTIMTGYDH